MRAVPFYVSFKISDIFVSNEIDYLRISHNASDMEAYIRVLSIRNSSSHSSLCQRLGTPVLSCIIVFYETT